MRKVSALFFFLSTLGILLPTQLSAEILLQDDFTTGEWSGAANYPAEWQRSVRVSVQEFQPNQDALEFVFPGGPPLQDAWAEQRLTFPQQTETWVSYDLYIPHNYYHRYSGGSSGDNNKFFAIYNNSYSPGFQVNFTAMPKSDGSSYVDIRYYRNGSEGGNWDKEPATGWPTIVDRNTDLGKWMSIKMHFKVPTSTSINNGVMQLWKNGQLILDIQNLDSHGTSGLNFMDEAYILGWSNSGFDEDTVLYVDNIVVSDQPIDEETASPPEPPGNFSVVVDP